MHKPERGKEILYLSRQDVEDTGFTGSHVRELVRQALAEHGHKRCEMPAKIGIHPLTNSLMHAMPAWVPAAKACGIKWAECFPGNFRHNLPQTSGLMILNCPETGWPLCVMDAVWVTAKRTPAVTGLACEFLARKDVEEAGIVGAGVQGREHVPVLVEVLPHLKRLKIFDRMPDAARKVVSDFQERFPRVELIPVRTLEEAVRHSLVVVSATAILFKPNPQIRDEWVEPGALLAPIDFDSLWEWETFARADKFLVDSHEEMKYFMTVGYLPHGLPMLHAEIGEVVAGVKPGRQRDEELIVDMNIGMGVEDVVVGRALYEQACERGLGSLLPL